MQNVSPYSGLDASLRWSRPRDILSRYLPSKESAVSFMVPPVLNSFSISCTDIRTDDVLTVLYSETLNVEHYYPERIYLSVYIPSDSVLTCFVHTCCYLLKSVCKLFPHRQETAPKHTRAAKYHRRRIINCSIIPFLSLLFKYANIYLFVPSEFVKLSSSRIIALLQETLNARDQIEKYC